MKNNQVVVVGLIGQSLFLEVKHFPQKGETVEATKTFSEIGGKGFNQALAARRMNADVTFLSVVGKDDLAQTVKANLNNEKINFHLVEKDGSTPFACILIDKAGNNQVIVGKETINLFNENDISKMENVFKQCSVLLLQGEIPHLTNQKVITLAKNTDTFIIYNPAPARKEDLDFIQQVNLFTPNELEAKFLFGSDWEEKLPGYCAKNKTTIIVTRGKKGAVLFTPVLKKEYKAISSDAVDTTGAGDAFHGALGAFLATNHSLDESMKKALVVAGLSVRKKGIIHAYPTLQELMEFEK